MIDKRLESAIKKAETRKLKSKESEKKKISVEQSACEVFSTDAGKRVLLWLMEECSFQKSNIVATNSEGELSYKNILWNESRRDVYLRLRLLLKSRPDILESVEIYKLRRGIDE